MAERGWILLFWVGAIALAFGESTVGLESRATNLVDITDQVKTGGDGCSGAYKKFKGEVDKMAQLKTKAEKASAKEKKAAKQAKVLLKRCTKDHKEILKKASWKKSVIKKKIKEGAKKESDKLKKKIDAKMKAEKKKMKKKMATAKKKEKKHAALAEQWKKKEKATKRRLKAKYKKDLAKFKNEYKIQMKKKVKVQIAAGMVRKSKDIQKKEKAKFKAKLQAVLKKADANLKSEKKKCLLAKNVAKEKCKAALKKAKKSIPTATEKELTETKGKLQSKTTETAKEKAALQKTKVTLKDTKSTLSASLGKQKIKAEDCASREKRLIREANEARTRKKTDKIKIEDQAKAISRHKQKIKLLQQKLEAKTAVIKGKVETIGMQDTKLKAASRRAVECGAKVKRIMSKMSAGEGALMGEIERNKKTIAQEKEQNTVIGNQLRKCRLEAKKLDRRYNRKVVKNRELGQSLYNTKRSLDKWKAKHERVAQEYTLNKERKRATQSKLELCRDRIRDANVKKQGCQEAMRRMKTYTTDQINQQRMDANRLRQQLKMARKSVDTLAIKRQEKEKAESLASQAAKSAATKAVQEEQAKALAVKANAKNEVARAAKEAVKLATAQAKKQANSVVQGYL